MTHHIQVGTLKVEVVRKDIKNLHLGVYPPEGRVRVAAPLRVNDEAVRMAVISRLPWIKRQQGHFHRQPRQSCRQYVARESHYFLGRRYLLNVVHQSGPAKVAVKGAHRLDLFVPVGADAAKREQVLLAWYRKELKALIPSLVEKWQSVLGVQLAAWGIKRMKTRWGTCNVEARRIWLNLELAKKPVHCLEYIIVHELVHLLERHHNDRFIAIMDEHLPKWRTHRRELNSAPLAHETWSY